MDVGPAVDADVFVVGTSIDPHVDAVLERLSSGLAVCRLNVDEFPASHRVTVSTLGGGPSVWIDTPAGSWNVTGCPAVWFRRLGRPGIAAELSEAHRRFAAGEAEEALNGALSLLEPGTWLNEYWATRRAATKLLQYEAARRLGVPTPATLVSSDPHRARRFLGDGNGGGFVFKTLHSPVIDYPDRQSRGFVFTSRVDEAERGRLDRLRYGPAQFQRCIEVAYELRVTSVGKEHFAVRIDGAASDSRVRDWRAERDRLRHSSVTLPELVADRLTELLQNLNLEFGASDWIVTPEGEHVFLEVNPHGAWLWLEEELADLSISAAIARFLEAACRDRT